MRRFEIGIELRQGVLLLVVRTTSEAAGEQARIEIPVEPGLARALASQLLEAAKAADPAGHEAVIAGIRELFTAAILEAMPVGRTN